VLCTSCKKWLDVKPQDKFLESQIYSSEQAAVMALNGLYLQMASNDLYGQNLTMGTLDIMGQMYNVPGTTTYNKVANYAYTTDEVKAIFSAVWQSAYVTVTNTNDFLDKLGTYSNQSKIKPSRDSLMRGEALGIRALIHFDMLRLFGPMYNADSVKPSIPYYRKVTPTISPLYPAKAIIDSVLDDLRAAEKLLVNDPVRQLGSATTTASDPTQAAWINRNQTFNYFAVKGLQARVYLYRGDTTSALQAAKAVIAEADPLFPWVNPPSILNDKDNPPRVMASECLFALYTPGLYTNYQNLFAPSLLDVNILAPNTTRLNATYENNTNDYRFNPVWIQAATSNKSYKTFYKYADVANSASGFRFLQAMVRKSEMYLIAAECDTASNKLNYLNTYRYNRGLAALPAGTNVATELLKEYPKEFYGEGQVFYYYKRLKLTAIKNGSATSGNVSMNAAKYVVSLPLAETQYR
jgi:hypothetical protein